MKSPLISFLSFLLPVIAVPQESFELAPPLIKYSSVFFKKKTKAEIKFAKEGASVYYTLNGEEPTLKSNVCKGPVLIQKNFTVLKAKAIGEGFLPSETTEVTFIKDGLPIMSIEYTSPDKKYPGNGVNALADNQGGHTDLAADTWLGYYCDTVNVLINLRKKQRVGAVLISFLQNESSWIFLPEKITIDYADPVTGDYVAVKEEKYSADKETPESHCVYRMLNLVEKRLTDKIMIRFFVTRSIPDWHPAKGNHAWMFIDEIKVY